MCVQWFGELKVRTLINACELTVFRTGIIPQHQTGSATMGDFVRDAGVGFLFLLCKRNFIQKIRLLAVRQHVGHLDAGLVICIGMKNLPKVPKNLGESAITSHAEIPGGMGTARVSTLNLSRKPSKA